MGHKIDTENLTRNAFLLRHLACGNEQVFGELRFTREKDAERSNGWGHQGLLLQQMVSELLIDTAIKLRIILDVLWTQAKEDTRDSFEAVFEGRNTVGFFDDEAELSIREACNKIVHARKVKLQWMDGASGDYEYWDGILILCGTKGTAEWQCSIVVQRFCDVLEEYIDEIDQTRDYIYSWFED